MYKCVAKRFSNAMLLVDGHRPQTVEVRAGRQKLPSRRPSAGRCQAVDPCRHQTNPCGSRAGGSWLGRDRKPDRLVRKYDQSDCRPVVSDPKHVVGVQCVQMVSEARVLPRQTFERKLGHPDLHLPSLNCRQQSAAMAPITAKRFPNHYQSIRCGLVPQCVRCQCFFVH